MIAWLKSFFRRRRSRAEITAMIAGLSLPGFQLIEQRTVKTSDGRPVTLTTWIHLRTGRPWRCAECVCPKCVERSDWELIASDYSLNSTIFAAGQSVGRAEVYQRN